MPTRDSRLGAEEAGGLDLRFEFRDGRARERARVRIAREERRRDHVHALIGALRGEDRRDQQLVRVREVEFGVGIRVLGRELARMRRVSAGGRGDAACGDGLHATVWTSAHGFAARFGLQLHVSRCLNRAENPISATGPSSTRLA